MAASPPNRGLPDRLVAIVRRDLPLGALDAVIVLVAYLGLLVLRFDGSVPAPYWDAFRVFLAVVLVVHLVANAAFGLYGQMWQHASVQEARRLLLSGVCAAVIVVALGALGGGHVVPRFVAVVGPVLCLLGFGVLRFQARLFAFHRREAKAVEAHADRVLLYGTGEAGATVLRDILRDPGLGMRVVGLLDDDPRRRGLSLHGISVLGGRDEIPRVTTLTGATQVLLAIPSATSDLIRDVAERCEEADLRLRVLPSVREVVGGRVTARDIRDLSIEDLLGRQQVETDLAAVRALLAGRRVLVTGAGGSIGSEIARQVAEFGPEELVLVDHDETHLFEVAQTLPADVRRRQVLLDIRDADRVADVFASLAPQVVFHAAAHKHVPILERFPREAALTNVLGTANVVDAATAAHAERLIFISSDKAIRPRSVMGASKRMAEEVVRGFTGNGTVACCVRFGNVLGSRGSVLGAFRAQIEMGGPITVTDPEVTRYFMTVEEAVQLVIQAGAMEDDGGAMVLDMGEPVRIADVARRLADEADRRIEIVYTGLRPGEKLHEVLASDDESPRPTCHELIAVVDVPPLERDDITGLCTTDPDTLLAELSEYVTLRKAATNTD